MGNLKKQNKQMKFAIAALLGSASATILNQYVIDAERAWFDHIDENSLSYGTKEEYEFRKSIFKTTYAEVQAHNSLNMSHKLTTNFMSTWTKEERKRLNGYQASDRVKAPVMLDESNLGDGKNWVDDGAVTKVKNQGQCGSCWSFSTTGSMEGAHFLTSGNLVSLSEQQLVDCDRKHDNGCNGGLMDYAFEYTKTNPLQTEDSYPYEAKRKTCTYEKSEGVVSASDYHDVANSEAQLKAAINKTPVSVAIVADQSSFQLYHGGVITHGCGTRLDHGVLAVGWGTLDDEEYILVKNSWGPSWGDHGYVRIAPNQCGITHAASYPTTD